MGLTFNDNAGRFVNERGQFVSRASVHAVINDIADGASERIAALGRQLLAGEVSLAEWQAGCMRTIKHSQVAAATIAHGGAARMTPSAYGAVGAQLRSQYGYLRTFAEQIADGRQPLTQGLVARAEMYGQQARAVFEREYGRDQQGRGYRSERNVLHSAEHCASCRAESARGWAPIGSLVPVGRRTCLSRCRCTISYRREPAEQAA